MGVREIVAEQIKPLAERVEGVREYAAAERENLQQQITELRASLNRLWERFPQDN